MHRPSARRSRGPALTVEALCVLAVLALIIAILALTRIAPDAVLLGGLTLLMTLPVPHATGWRIGLIPPREALAGFSNPGVITIAALFVLVAGMRQTGAIDWIAQIILGRPRALRPALTRLVLSVSAISAFVNNTPVVAMLIPAVNDWARKLGFRPSKFLIPLSYAAILGGTCSLIGTSTNLVVYGMVLAEGDLPPPGMFDITWVGLPCALVGAAFLILFGPRLLPDRGSAASALADPREYTIEMLVPPKSPLIGRTIEEAGLRSLPGCYLVEIDRGDETLVAVGPEQKLHANDRLVFVGVVDSVRDLQRMRGLVPATDQVFKLDSPRYRRHLFEAVVSNTCPLVGKTIREGRFRSIYNAAVIAVARNGERLPGKIGDIRLRPGDTLLLEAAPNFAERYRDSRDFFLVSSLEDSSPPRTERALLAISILAALVIVAAFGWLDMLLAAMLAAGAMILTRCCTISAARRSVNWSVLVAVAAALGVGRAMELSGAARFLAEGVLALCGPHPWVALVGVFAITACLAALMTNAASAAVMFPIVLETTRALGVSLVPFLMVLMCAASASFASPLGYQTNLMVYGPGGYLFRDFLRVGIPMTVLVGITAVLVAPLRWPLHP